MANDYLTQLAAFAADTPGEAIPPEIRERAALILADCAGCIAAGSRAEEVVKLTRHLEDRGRAREALVLGTDIRLKRDAAAYVSGIAGTWHDLDEGNLHTRAHAAIQIAPALLAEAEAGAYPGRAVIDALVLAYEVAGRLWRATTAHLAVHPHGTYGPLAAAVAIARLRGIEAPRLRNLMNIAMTLGTAASRQALGDGATVRNVYTGHSGRAAFEAHLLDGLGFGGEHDAPGSILGNIYGTAFDPGTAIADLGETWWMGKSYFKRFASGRYTHAALDAVEALAARLGDRLAGDNIARIDVDTFFLAATMGQQSVATPFGLRFSIPAAIASRVLRGAQDLTDDGRAAFEDPRVHALAKRIFVTENETMTASYPDTQPASVTVTFADGATETEQVTRILGESDRPLAESVLEEKYVALTSPALGATAARASYARWLSLDDAPSLRQLTDDFCAAARTHQEATP